MKTTGEIVIQSITAFVVLFILARIMGKRQVAQLTFFDYIVGITIGNIAATWSLDDATNLHAIVTLLLWTALSLIVAWIQRKSFRGRHLFDGKPELLVENGHVLERNLRKANLTVEELMTMLRQKDVFKLSDVETAVFENNGTLSVMKKKAVSPATPQDLHLSVLEEKAPRIVIVNGHVLGKSLAATGYTEEWLLEEVRKQGAASFTDVFVAQIDSEGSVYVDLFADTLHTPAIPEKPLLRAKLKGLQADLETFALETHNPEAKESYRQMAQRLSEVIRRVSPYLQ
ncbi:MAG: DUF421 domain-containing protein [Alicyclobacillus sp.]|nr:DUF421 domain-containing protein [Alicyclobacillus sp.]